ncbi:MAG: hypothetical protein K2W99_02665 [Chthoniobacterales bacterium]|nr:hypothetical protein [Chthoniobacterales bacterium]
MKNIYQLFSQAICFHQLLFLSTILLLLMGCADHSASNKREETTPSKFGYGGTNTDIAFVTAEENANSTNMPVALLDTNTTTPSNTPATNPPANPFLSAPASTTAATTHDIPYGTPVPGKPGFVTSPFAPKDRYVDVRGFPPGSEVKDPYSGKIFLVP